MVVSSGNEFVGVSAALVVLERMWRDFFINGLVASSFLANPVRGALMRLSGFHVPIHGIRPGNHFGGRSIFIGEGTFINYRCFFDGSAPIHIGRKCGIGMEVMFCTSTHAIGPAAERAGRVCPRPITIGDGCWIGTRAVILPGVTVGDGCVVAAGAVVAKDCAPNGMYAGVPARRIKDLPVQECR
jgi:maltose O-acetyltransferase